MTQLQSLLVSSALVVCCLLGATLAQTLSAPLNALSSSNWGSNVYLYNPATESIVSPTTDGGLTMIPWQYYDNTTMQWTITQYSASPQTFYISAVSPQAAGCAAGNTANWSAPQKAPVGTVCTPATSMYSNFLIVGGSAQGNFVFIANSNSNTCIAVINGVPTSPATVCNPLGDYAQFQLVTISHNTSNTA